MANGPLKKAADSLVKIEQDKRAAALSGGGSPALRKAADSLVKIEHSKRASALKNGR